MTEDTFDRLKYKVLENRIVVLLAFIDADEQLLRQALDALVKVKHGAWDEDTWAGRELVSALRERLGEKE